MTERRILKHEDLTGIVGTSQVVATPEEKDDVDRFIAEGRVRIEDNKVFYHDPQMVGFSARDTYEINLDGGFFVFEPPSGAIGPPIPTPVNLGPLAYLRQLAGWAG